MIEPTQIVAARALLEWDQKTLAKHAGLSVSTIVRAETGDGILLASIRDIERAIFSAGVKFTESGGVDWREGFPKHEGGENG